MERLTAAEELAAREQPDEHGPRLDSLAQRIDEIAASTSERQTELGQGLEKAVAELRSELAAQRAEDAGRAEGVEREAALLGDQLSELRAALEAQVDSRTAADAELGGRVDAVAGSLERETSAQEELATTVGDVRAELGALAARLDESAAATGDVLRALRSEVAEVSSLARPVDEPTKLEAELRARVDELERRLDEPPAEIEPEAATSVDELAIETVTEPEPVLDPAADGAYLAFVPNDQGYSLHELDGPLPAVGQPLPGSAGEQGLVVARVGRSPLPLDRRQCVYLELAVVADPSDRVT
jgi:chromosome segregation ATPase